MIKISAMKRNETKKRNEETKQTKQTKETKQRNEMKQRNKTMKRKCLFPNYNRFNKSCNYKSSPQFFFPIVM